MIRSLSYAQMNPERQHMKGKSSFQFLDPTITQARTNRIQFALNDEEHATLKLAAELQGTKVGELAGLLFRKYILPGLAEDVELLQTETSNATPGNTSATPSTTPATTPGSPKPTSPNSATPDA